QIVGHDVDRINEVLDLVIALDFDALVEIADGNAIDYLLYAVEATADAHDDPGRGYSCDKSRTNEEADQQQHAVLVQRICVRSSLVQQGAVVIDHGDEHVIGFDAQR